jgi:hypothetical protein
VGSVYIGEDSFGFTAYEKDQDYNVTALQLTD